MGGGTLVIADSRGRGLQQLISPRGSDACCVLVHSGAGSELAVLRSLRAIDNVKPDLIILMTGICDLTWRHSRTGLTQLRSTEVDECVSRVLGAIRAALDLLATPARRISIATLTGLDLADYNHKPRRNMSDSEYEHYCKHVKIAHPHQGILNDTIVEVNRQIIALNKAASMPTTWLAGRVHSCFKNKYRHFYKHLIDGCHPSGGTRDFWAAQVSKSVKKTKNNDVE